MITELIEAGIFLIETFICRIFLSWITSSAKKAPTNDTFCPVNSEANARRIALVEGCFGTSGQPLGVPGAEYHLKFNFLELVHFLVCWWVSTKYQVKGTFPKVTFMFSRLLLDNKMFQAGFLWERGYWQKHAGKSQSPGKKSDRTIWS